MIAMAANGVALTTELSYGINQHLPKYGYMAIESARVTAGIIAGLCFETSLLVNGVFIESLLEPHAREN